MPSNDWKSIGKPQIRINVLETDVSINILAMTFLLLLSGCSANLEYSVSDYEVVKIQDEYTLTGCKTDEFSMEKVEQPSHLIDSIAILKARYDDYSLPDRIAVPAMRFKVEGQRAVRSISNSYRECLVGMLDKEAEFSHELSNHYLDCLSSLSYETGIVCIKAHYVDQEISPSRSQMVYKKTREFVITGPKHGGWVTREGPAVESIPAKYRRELVPISKEIGTWTILRVNVDTINFREEFSRTGFFFNQIRSGIDQLSIHDLIAMNGYDGVMGNVTVQSHYTLLRSIHDILPFCTGVGSFFVFQSLYEKNNGGARLNSFLYAVPVGILSYIATNLFLNIFIPDQISITVEMKMAKLKGN